MKHICTYFDINFLPRGLALLDSIEKNSDNFMLYILALDEEVVDFFTKLDNKNVNVILLQDYSKYFSIDKNKYQNEKEFYFSITPAICLYVIKNYKDVDLLLYLDADVYLFNNIEILYKEIGDSSISMCSHRIPWYIDIVSKNYGVYNVGVNAFRNDEEGIKCLEQWHKDCSEWTINKVDYPLSFFSDQIWLDKWPDEYKNIKVLNHKGINTAPWNAIQYKFSKKNDIYFVDDEPLVIYHFSSLKDLGSGKWHCNTSFTILNINGYLKEIYKKYIKHIDKYSHNSNRGIMNLKFTGSKVKMIVYKLLNRFHNHIIEIRKDKY
jgi:hypothetical protein